jgi:cellulose synthase (UDP-forming)
LVPLVASWCGINIVVLLLVCMLCLQMPVRRGEERFEMDEPVWLRTASGAVALGRIRDISLSGVGVALDTAAPADLDAGASIRVFIPEVGLVPGKIARGRGSFVGVQFDLPISIERDLLIRKIFTGGLNTTTVVANAWSVTIGLLRSIWTVRSAVDTPATPAVPVSAPAEKLPARTLVEPPAPATLRLADLAAERRALAA